MTSTSLLPRGRGNPAAVHGGPAHGKKKRGKVTSMNSSEYSGMILEAEMKKKEEQERLQQYLQSVGHKQGQPLRDEQGKFISREELLKYLDRKPKKKPRPEALRFLCEEFVQNECQPHVYELKLVWTQIGKEFMVIMGVTILIALLV